MVSCKPANGCNAIRLRCPKFYDDADKCRRGNFMRVKRIVEYNKNKVGSITSSEFSPWQTFCLGNYIPANLVISIRGQV